MSIPPLVDQFYGRIWNDGDLTAIQELLSPTFTFRGSLGPTTSGREPFAQYVTSVRSALAEYQCRILDCVAEGGMAFARMEFSGQHVGPFRGFEPTHKDVRWLGAAFFRFQDGLIADLWVLGDLAGLDALLRMNQANGSASAVTGSKRVCVGAIIRDAQGRVFVQRRSATRRVFPGVWDIVGGHVEPNESIEAALEREIHEETGWRLRRMVALIAEWEWEHGSEARRELDYLVEVEGDLASPRLEPREHDAYAWIGVDDLERLAGGGTRCAMSDSPQAHLRLVFERLLTAT